MKLSCIMVPIMRNEKQFIDGRETVISTETLGRPIAAHDWSLRNDGGSMI